MNDILNILKAITKYGLKNDLLKNDFTKYINLFDVDNTRERFLTKEEIQTLYEKTREDETIDFEEYFEDIVGVTLYDEKPIEKIVLQIKNVLWPYIQTKPIHGSQKFIQTNESFTTISLDLIPNYELESILFSYVEGLEVLSPKHFRDKMKNRSKEIFSNYKKNAVKLHSL